MNAQLKRYIADVGWPTAAYIASVVAAALLTRQMAPGTLRLLVAALPLPSVLWLAHAELQRLRRRDELRQRIELEALAAAFSVTLCLVVMLAFLKMFAGIGIGIEVVAVVMAACWLAAQCWVRARYRYGWLQPDDGEGERMSRSMATGNQAEEAGNP